MDVARITREIDYHGSLSLSLSLHVEIYFDKFLTKNVLLFTCGSCRSIVVFITPHGFLNIYVRFNILCNF